MTEIIQFLFSSINKFFELMSSFEFSLFGFETNLLYLFLAFIIIGVLVSFLRMGMNISKTEIVSESVRHRLKVNRENERADAENLSASYRKGTRGGRWI